MKKWFALFVWSLLVAVISALVTTAYFQHFVMKSDQTTRDIETTRELTDEQVAQSPIKDDIALIEVFSYSCGYCAERDADFTRFKSQLPAGKTMVKMHLTNDENPLGKTAEIFATLTTLGLEEAHRQEAFDAILKDRLDLTQKSVRDQWLQSIGINIADYETARSSVATQTLLEQMRAITEHYGVYGTPMFIVNKKWVVIQDRVMPEFKEYLLSLLNQA